MAATCSPSAAAGYSRLMAFSGAGAVLGALTVAWLGRFPRWAGRSAVQLALGFAPAAFGASRVLRSATP